MTQKKILMLGAGRWQVPWLEKAKSLDMIVYATDWSPRAEGCHIPHDFSAIDLRDKEATLAYAEAKQIDAIFTSADIGVPTAAYVAARMGLCYPSETLAHWATNKYAMRLKAQEIGLGIPQFCLVETFAAATLAAEDIGYPLVMKPVDQFSSKGVFVVNNQSELEACYPQSIAASFSGKILLEEFLVGTEGSVEALIRHGEIYILGICKKQKSALPYRYDLLLEYPGDYNPTQTQAIKNFIKKLVAGYDIKNGIIHVEFILNQNEVKLIEFAIRGCGSLVTTHLMPALTGYDVMDYLLWNAFDVQKTIHISSAHVGVLKFIMLPRGQIKHISGKAEVKAIPGVLEFDIERQPGDIIADIKDGRSRPGYLLAYAENKAKLNTIVAKALSSFNVEY